MYMESSCIAKRAWADLPHTDWTRIGVQETRTRLADPPSVRRGDMSNVVVWVPGMALR